MLERHKHSKGGCKSHGASLLKIVATQMKLLQRCQLHQRRGKCSNPGNTQPIVANVQVFELSESSKHQHQCTSTLGVFSRLHSLKHLVLAGIGIDETEMAAVAPALGLLPGLQTLDLSRTNLRGSSITVLAPVLGGLSELRSLHLDGNWELGWNGAAALGSTLSPLVSLRVLGLNGSELGSARISALAPAIQQLTLLQHLDIGNNWFGGEGAATCVCVVSGNREHRMQLPGSFLGSAALLQGPDAITACPFCGPSVHL